MSNSNKAVKGNLILIVLRLLYNNNWLYGYEIGKAVQAASRGQIRLTEAALYPVLHQLEEDKVVMVKPVMAEGRLRKYYKLSPKGKRIAAKELARFEENIAVLRKVLKFKIKR